MSDNHGRGRTRGDRGGSRGRGGDRGRGRGRGGGGAGPGDSSDMQLPYRPARGRGNDRGQGFDRGRGAGDFRGRGRGNGGFRGGGSRGPKIFNPGKAAAPDATVGKLENAMAKALVANQAKKATSPAQAYPDRPGYGTMGRPVTLYANYLSLTSVGKKVFRYHINLQAGPAGREPTGKKAKQIVRLLLEEHFPDRQDQIATDYRATLISCVKLEEKVYDVRYKDDLEEDSSDASAMLNNKPEILQALNVILGHYPKTDCSTVTVAAQRHYSLDTNFMEKQSLGGGLEVLRGFFVSVRAATARVLLNVQVKYLACYEAGGLKIVIGSYQRGNSSNTYRLEAFLKRMRVRITHIIRKTSSGKSRPRIKAIAGLAARNDGASSANPPRVLRHGAGPNEVEFFLSSPGTSSGPSNAQPVESRSGAKGKKGKKGPPKAGPPQPGRYVTVAQFFKEEYNISTDPKMPVVNVGTRENPVYLPVEVCEVEPGQPVGTKLSPSQTSNMLGFAVIGRNPAENAQSIVTKGVGVLGVGQPLNATLSAFGIKVSNELLTVQGRILPAPRVLYAKQKQITTMNGSWNMREIKFSKPVTMKKWAYLYVNHNSARKGFQNDNHLRECLGEFPEVLQSMGVDAAAPSTGTYVELNGHDDAFKIEEAVRHLQQSQPQLILGILYAKDTQVYNIIKQVCDVRCGVRNVNVQVDKVLSAKPQYWANVGLKINLKLGGCNQALRNSDLGIFANGKTMLVGIDVTHPSPGSSHSAPSVAGIVASVDAQLAQWPAAIRVQAARQEMVADLDALLQSRLKLWAARNQGKYPENIVIYRDGVSEGQYDLVIDKELPLLKAACRALYPASDTKNSLPRLAIIVVGKRHNTRFYPTSEDTADRSMNPVAGTVVDRGISEARHWDFYLQAHAALQGTARPAHYFTVWDEIFAPLHPGTTPGAGAADKLQDLTHKMCYLFGRATKAVSVCPPAYYADLVCTRARCYLSDLFDPSPDATPAGSVLSGAGGGRIPEQQQTDIHASVRDTMFYI
ncbi:hypothetical protein N7462_000611 [Penicillium macrosclerotiorum]|uniref:uncharacterized protein n=1 Tax=Penicillium macrosclerotiorum TaxID=303699 RepID=UPI002547595A|nr:uncharacterized protein N7462_000611 [Penicillium macrosclerotiorum]KAJ5698606.1 hypothetical protein N7462_000611 [Penicillium macrosclerotiorum]